MIVYSDLFYSFVYFIFHLTCRELGYEHRTNKGTLFLTFLPFELMYEMQANHHHSLVHILLASLFLKKRNGQGNKDN